MSKEILDKLCNAVANLDVSAATAAAKEAKAANIDATTAIEQGLAKGMVILSDKFDEGEVFIPQLILAAKAFDEAAGVLTEGMSVEDKAKTSRGKILIHTVQGDIHSIGKNIVATMLGASGFEVIDMGCDVPVDDVVAKAQAEKVDIIAGSALMTTTMPAMKDIVKALEEQGVRNQFKCLFGGAPVIEEWVMEFADGYADTATGAVKVALELLGK